MSVTVRYWAAAKAAAGTPEQQVPVPESLGALVAALADEHGPALAAVLARCSYLVDEVSPGLAAHDTVRVPDGAVVDVLPPFAGGAGGGQEHPRASTALGSP